MGNYKNNHLFLIWYIQYSSFVIIKKSPGKKRGCFKRVRMIRPWLLNTLFSVTDLIKMGELFIMHYFTIEIMAYNALVLSIMVNEAGF